MPLSLTTNFDRIIKDLEAGADRAVAETAEAIAEAARAAAPVDTRSLQESIYVVTPAHDGHGQAQAAAKRANPHVEILPALPLETTEDGIHAALVDVAAAHGVFVHNGTGSQSARPFLEEAGLNQAQAFEARLRAALNRL